MKFSKSIIIFPVLSILTACVDATPQQNPAYISPMQYQDYNCKQIRAEMNRVSTKIQQGSSADATNQVLGTALAAFAISQGYGFEDQDEDVGMRRLKNQYDVLEETAIKKQCGL